jgi:iron complex transport system ATP-binding protein
LPGIDHDTYPVPCAAMADAVLRFDDVVLRYPGEPPRTALDHVTWTVRPGDRWVVLGANGSGKTSTVRLAAGYAHPTDGRVDILGHRLGHVDVRELRTHIGVASGALAQKLRPTISALDAVMAARDAALETWWSTYGDADRAKARELLDRLGVGHVADQPLGTASDGERQRVQLARTLMIDPELLLLDEPTAGLDLGGREQLVERLAELARDPASPPIVQVTHHVEEIPPGFTHVLLLRAGRVLAAGPLATTLTADALEATFGVAVTLEQRGGRWFCFAR